MPIKQENAAFSSGAQEQSRVLLLSELIEELLETEALSEDGTLKPEADMIVIGIPDTGLGEFKGSHPWKNDASKDTKATFIVTTIGNDRAGFPIPYRQSQGDVNGLPLSVKLTVTARCPNQAGKTVDQALNREKPLVDGAVIEASKSNGSAQLLST